jgi:hypothetical protein
VQLTGLGRGLQKWRACACLRLHEKKIASLVFGVLLGGSAQAADFDWWHDGKAELDGYRLTVSHGGDRSGPSWSSLEPFSESNA